MSRSKEAHATTGGRWRNVTRSHRCAVCDHDSWCSYLDDVSMCRRVASDRAKVDSNGEEFWIHYPEGFAGAGREPLPPPPPSPRRADADTLDRAYRAVLGSLTLSTAHREMLRARGLTDDGIDRRGYRSLAVQGRAALAKRVVDEIGDTEAVAVPGIYWKHEQGRSWPTLAGAAGVVVPVRDLAGRIVALKVRRDDASDDHARYTYVSSAEHDGPSALPAVHVPVQLDRMGRDEIRITEGELKADVITALTGVLTLSIPGVGGWRRGVDVVREIGPHSVVLAFDADVRTNDHVKRAARNTADALVDVVSEVAVETWPMEAGKGLDDVLSAGKGDAVARRAIPREREKRTKAEAASEGRVANDVDTKPPVYSAATVARTRLYLGPAISTGIPEFDRALRGGLRSAMWIVAGGTPDAGKSTLMGQIGWHCAENGYPVAFLLGDEDRGRVIERRGQALGFDRDELTDEDPTAREALATTLETDSPHVFLLDAEDHTIESGAEALLEAAQGKQAVLVVDSLQSVRSALLTGDESDKQRLDIVVRAVKAATKRGLLVLAISEMNRGAYRTDDPSQRTNDLASFKESGAIEYGAPVACVLRRVKETPNDIEVTFAKNKLRGSDVPDRFSFFLRRDPARALFLPTSGMTEDDREAAREAAMERGREKMRQQAIQAVLKGRCRTVTEIVAKVTGRDTDKRAVVKDLIADGVLAQDSKGEPFRYAKPVEAVA